jgi:filamentous hemagglutinin
LSADGIKFNQGAVIATGRDRSGRIVFLEMGNNRSGLQHITKEHREDFGNIGVLENQIASVIMRAVTEGAIVGYQGRGKGRPIYQIQLSGRTQNIAVTTASNGYIVGANPAGGMK